MTFEGQYLTKQEYIALGGSSTIGDMPFNLLEFEARRLIDIKTFNRLKDGTNIPQEVKLCDYQLIDSIKSYYETINGINAEGNKASESTDGYSVSYITKTQVKDIIQTNSIEYNAIIDKYLMFVVYNNEHLLYRGL